MKTIQPRWIFAAVITLALLGAMWRAVSNKHAQQAAATSPMAAQTHIELANSDVMKAELRDITQGLAVSGTVKAVNYAVIKARVAGELKEVVAREGDAVKAGDVLARIDPTEYQRRWQQAAEQASAAKSQMEIAQRQWDSNKALVGQGFISQTAMDNSMASYQGAIATQKAPSQVQKLLAKHWMTPPYARRLRGLFQDVRPKWASASRLTRRSWNWWT